MLDGYESKASLEISERIEDAEDVNEGSYFLNVVDKKRLSEVDKKIIRALVASRGRISSLTLSRELDIPLTTVQRRRKRLESEFLEHAYSLKIEAVGWRKANLLISTAGRARAVGAALLTHDHVIRLCRSIGDHSIDLHAEIIFKDNKELLSIIEWIKAIDDVREVVWTEPVDELGNASANVPDVILRM